MPNQASSFAVAENMARTQRQRHRYALSILIAIGLSLPTTALQAESWRDLLGASGSKPASVGLSNQKNFLPVEQAFDVFAQQQGDKLQVQFRVTPGYYLYQQRFRLTTQQGKVKIGALSYDREPTWEDDPAFGRVAVFAEDVALTTTVSGQGQIQISYQGCAKAGLCYPPQRVTVPIKASSRDPAVARPDRASSSNDTFGKLIPGVDVPLRDKPAAKTPETAPSPPTVSAPAITATDLTLLTDQRRSGALPGAILLPVPADLTESGSNQAAAINALGLGLNRAPDETVNGLPFSLTVSGLPDNLTPPVLPSGEQITAAQEADGIVLTDRPSGVIESASSTLTNASLFPLSTHPWFTLAALFMTGIALSLTPCVWPMLPIVANLVARQHSLTWRRGLALASAYAVGVACSYALLGALVGAFGQQINLIGWLQQPLILLGFALVFVLLALVSFEVVQLRLPGRFAGRSGQFFDQLSQQGQQGRLAGRLGGAWITGFFSALVVSPCISAPLFGALTAVMATGSPVWGAAALFMLGLGLSVPLLVLGATEGRWLPKAGQWMHWVRQGFGLLLLGVALDLILRVWHHPGVLILAALWLFGLAFWLWQWRGRARFVALLLAALLASLGLVQVAGAISGATDPYRPLARLMPAPVLKPVATVHNLTELAALQNQYPLLLVDVTADWCRSCRINERNLFTEAPNELKLRLARLPRVMLDVTENTPASEQVLKHYQLFGPPALIFTQRGHELGRLTGEPTPAELAAALDKLGL